MVLVAAAGLSPPPARGQQITTTDLESAAADTSAWRGCTGGGPPATTIDPEAPSAGGRAESRDKM